MWSLLCGLSWGFAPVSLSAGTAAVAVPAYFSGHQDSVLLTNGDMLAIGPGDGPLATSRVEGRVALGSRWSLGLGLCSWSHLTAHSVSSVELGPPRSETPIGQARSTLVYFGPRIALQVRGLWLLPWLGCYASVAAGRPVWGRLTLEGGGLDGQASGWLRTGLAMDGAVGARLQRHAWGLELGATAAWLEAASSPSVNGAVNDDGIAARMASEVSLGPPGPGLELTVIWTPWEAR